MEKILRFRPPRIAVGLFAISAILSHLSPDKTLLHLPYKLLGSAGLVCGFVLMMWAWGSFKKVHTVVCHSGEASVLVTRGVYAKSRNPMYLGMLLMLGGAAFLFGDISAFIAPAAFFLIIDKVFVPDEEARMTRAFGDEYREYTERTRRWL